MGVWLTDEQFETMLSELRDAYDDQNEILKEWNLFSEKTDFERLCININGAELQRIGYCIDTLKNAVKVQTPHGRLVDANHANEMMLFHMSGTGYQSRAMEILKYDTFSPTVIEAEE